MNSNPQEIKEGMDTVRDEVHDFAYYVNRRCSKCSLYVPKDGFYFEAYSSFELT